jgi:tetratricopeptide (TPR) repeat protein
MRRRTALVTAGLLAAGLGGLLALRPRPAAAAPDRADTAIVSRSIAFFEQRLARDPGNALLAGQLANRYVQRFNTGADLADVARAETLAAATLATTRDPAGALARLSGIQLMQHRFAEAFASAEAAVAAGPESAEALGALLEAALATGRYGLADSVAPRLGTGTLAGRVRWALYLDARGETAAAFRLLDRACDELQRTAAAPPVTAWCLTQLAGLDHAVRGPAEAAATLRRALAIQPGYRGAAERLADLDLARGRARRAARAYAAVVSDAHPDLYLRLADARRALGDTAGARAAETRFLAVAGDPAHEALFGNLLALWLAERGDGADRDSALALARRDVARRPTHDAWHLLAWVHHLRGEPAEALAASDRGRTWGAPSPTADLERGLILHALGRREEGAALVEAAAAVPTLLAPHARRALAAPGAAR